VRNGRFRRLATKHPDVVLSYFGLYAEPIYGVFLFSFDTPEQARRGARKEEQRALKHCEERLRQGWFWEEACYLVNTPRLV